MNRIDYPLHRAATTAAVAAFASFAYFAPPALRFAPSDWLLLTGVMLGVGVGGHYYFLISDERLRWQLPFTAAGMAAIIALGTISAAAMDRSRANDRRCATVQADMLSAHPRIANGPDVFQALGCSPSGTNSRIFVPPTDRERAAGRALPDGGYSPPR